MRSLKSAKQNSDNIEFLQTYYTGNKEPSKGKTFSFSSVFNPRRLSLYNALYIVLGVIFLAFVIVAVQFYRQKGIDSDSDITPPSASHISGITYYDYARLRVEEQTLSLSQGRPYAAIELGEISDLSDSTISFAAKGTAGTEKIAIILRDKHNFSNANREDVLLTPLLSHDSWQIFQIDLSQVTLPLAKSRVTQIRFDASSRLTSNDLNAEVFIKDILIE